MGKDKIKRNYLLERMTEIFKHQQKGKVLDLGCGQGDYSLMLQEQGFGVIATDLDEKNFRHINKIQFKKCDVTKELPFPDNSFDYVVFFEVIEHLKNPYSVIAEIRRVLKNGGKIFISTPNILNIKSRLRFLVEGAYEFFREPPLEQSRNPKESVYNLHILPLRLHEMEYLLVSSGFRIEDIFTSIYEGMSLAFLVPLIKLQLFLKHRRSKNNNSIDYSKIHKKLLSKELLFGRHLVLKAEKI